MKLVLDIHMSIEPQLPCSTILMVLLLGTFASRHIKLLT
uniref:Uncharacterized protein n=1 Tax=Anguilla anguilla TaxID=7936 RepID=A0A0E9U8F9_ANGAN